MSYHFRVIGGGFAIPVIFEGSSRFRVDQLETRDDTVRSNCRPLGNGPGKGGSEHRRCFTSKLGVIISAVIELDRTAGVGHKPPRRLSGTFLPTLLVTLGYVVHSSDHYWLWRLLLGPRMPLMRSR